MSWTHGFGLLSHLEKFHYHDLISINSTNITLEKNMNVFVSLFFFLRKRVDKDKLKFAQNVQQQRSSKTGEVKEKNSLFVLLCFVSLPNSYLLV